MYEHVFQREQIVHRAIDDTFDFFADPSNLQAITPDWLHFRILTPQPITMRQGTVIEYRIRWGLFPMRWTTLIEEWDPRRGFVDRQLSGPYRRWRHHHRFEAVSGGTRMTDEVRYVMPWGPLGELAHALLVRRDLQRIFDHRRAKIAQLLDEAPARGAVAAND